MRAFPSTSGHDQITLPFQGTTPPFQSTTRESGSRYLGRDLQPQNREATRMVAEAAPPISREYTGRPAAGMRVGVRLQGDNV